MSVAIPEDWEPLIERFKAADAALDALYEEKGAPLPSDPEDQPIKDEWNEANAALDVFFPAVENRARDEGRAAAKEMADLCPSRVNRALLLDMIEHLDLDDGYRCACCQPRITMAC